MVTRETMIYLIENDHKLREYCEEHDVSANAIPLEDFKEIAKKVGWVMSSRDYELHHNTRTLPNYYYIRIDQE
jgi:hypothetical protein